VVLTMQRQDRDLPAGTVVSSRQKGRAIMDKSGEQTIKYGVTPVDVMASMSGLDFVRAIFARRLPEPPIMQTVEPFDCTAKPGVVVIHSVPALRHYNPIGSVHGGDAAILLDSAMGLAVQSTLPGSRLHHAGIQDLIRARHERDERRRPHRGPRAQCRPTRRHRGGAHHRCKRSADRACDDNMPCLRDSKGERKRLNCGVGRNPCSVERREWIVPSPG
jgi:acyl-coenzyme A thioesterase PaaI-like protein